MEKKSCSNCVSRFICPNNYRTCDGWNDEDMFWALIRLHFPNDDIDRRRKFLKSLRAENGGNDDGKAD